MNHALLFQGALDDVELESTEALFGDLQTSVSWNEKCSCEKGYVGDRCERCDTGYTRAPGQNMYGGRYGIFLHPSLRWYETGRFQNRSSIVIGSRGRSKNTLCKI